jgi:hypothetical protein
MPWIALEEPMSDTPFQPRSAVVTIYGGDFLDRIRHLERLAEAAKEAAEEDGPRLNSEVPEYLELARQHDELVKEAEESALHIRVQALPRKVFKALTAQHPPRTVKDDGVTPAKERSDALSGLDDDTFKDALIYGGEVEVNGISVPYRSIVEPEDITAEMLDNLSDIDFDRIYLTAFAMNRGTAPDPKASLVSRLTQKSGETSS